MLGILQFVCCAHKVCCLVIRLIKFVSEEGYVVRVGLEAGLTGTVHHSIIKTAAVGSVKSLSISQDRNVMYALSDSWVVKIPTWLEDACQHASTCR